jgi:hypothetical protein
MLMSEDIIVRRARTEDIHRLTDLANRTFRDTYEADNDPSGQVWLSRELLLIAKTDHIDVTSDVSANHFA